LQARGRELREEAPVEEEIPHDRAATVAPLEQDRLRTEIRDHAGGLPPVRVRADRHPREGFGFGNVRRDEIAARKKIEAEGLQGAAREQARAALRDHDRIEDHVPSAMPNQGAGDDADPRGVDEHADLDGTRTEVLEDRVELPAEEG